MPERTAIEWDKDDIDALGLMKVDVLALGMLTCIRKGLDLLKEHENLQLEIARHRRGRRRRLRHAVPGRIASASFRWKAARR
jgi:hypothetical protein